MDQSECLGPFIVQGMFSRNVVVHDRPHHGQGILRHSMRDSRALGGGRELFYVQYNDRRVPVWINALHSL